MGLQLLGLADKLILELCRYAAKLEGEGAAMYDAAVALRDAMLQLGLACDGGKDSVSMVASVASEVGACLHARFHPRLSRQDCAVSAAGEVRLSSGGSDRGLPSH